MSVNLKKWRDSATLLLVAKQKFWPSKNVDFNNYKVLSMKTSSKSKFMPDTHVFPGGTLDKADSSHEWLKLFNKFGLGDNSFKKFNKIKYISPIFDNANDGSIPKYISLRICAIREAFEECGVLLCKSVKSDQNIDNSWASYFSEPSLTEWQKRVHNDPNKFLELCNTFEIYPDIWSLYEWSNWLTPSGMPRRFDTIFFIAAVQTEPATFAEQHEVQHLEWTTPEKLLIKNEKHIIFLPPPQYYELSRLMNFPTIEELLKFSEERALHGCERILPYRLSTENIEISLLPGDELYPGEEEAQVPNEEILEEIPESEVMHRMIYKDVFKNKLILSNYEPHIKHVKPIIININSKL